MSDRPDRVTQTAQTTEYNAKTTIPSEWGRKLSYIAADLGLPKHELLRQAVALLLRFHGHDAPEPTPPVHAAGVTP